VTGEPWEQCGLLAVVQIKTIAEVANKNTPHTIGVTDMDLLVQVTVLP
jgi:hypothetical protein